MKNLIFKDIEDQLQFILRCNDAFDKYLNQDSPKYNKFKFTLRIGSYYIFAANDGTEPDITRMQFHSIKEIEFFLCNLNKAIKSFEIYKFLK